MTANAWVRCVAAVIAKEVHGDLEAPVGRFAIRPEYMLNRLALGRLDILIDIELATTSTLAIRKVDTLAARRDHRQIKI